MVFKVVICVHVSPRSAIADNNQIPVNNVFPKFTFWMAARIHCPFLPFHSRNFRINKSHCTVVKYWNFLFFNPFMRLFIFKVDSSMFKGSIPQASKKRSMSPTKKFSQLIRWT